MIGQSAAVRRVFDQVEQVAPTDSTVLILGETGTGKELVARAHPRRASPRARRAVRRASTAPPSRATLIESELFGHEKGAFTGAIERRSGRFELAHGGTLFLDEIGDLPLELQVKLLRVLQERRVRARRRQRDARRRRARDRRHEPRPRRRRSPTGKFRDDLYYRLNVFPIAVPPLRERERRHPVLVRASSQKLDGDAEDRSNPSARRDRGAAALPWPGNVRELRNVIERSVIVSSGGRLRIATPRPSIRRSTSGARLADVERDHLRSVLEQTAWRIRGKDGAAEQLGLKPGTLESRMTRLDLRRPPRP